MLRLARHCRQMLLFVPDIRILSEKYHRFSTFYDLFFLSKDDPCLFCPAIRKFKPSDGIKERKQKGKKSETHTYSSIPIPMPFLVELIAENVISLNRGGGVRMKRARRHEIEARICIFPCWFRVGSRATRGGTSTERRFLNRSGAYRARTTRGLKIRRIDRIITRT